MQFKNQNWSWLWKTVDLLPFHVWRSFPISHSLLDRFVFILRFHYDSGGMRYVRSINRDSQLRYAIERLDDHAVVWLRKEEVNHG